MSADRYQLLDQAVAMTHRMQACGSEGRWDEVIALEPQRRSLLEQAFATRDAVDERLAARVREILEIDKQLMQYSLKARDQAAEELGLLSRGRKGSNAYRATAR
jgi:hypothetical protein